MKALFAALLMLVFLSLAASNRPELTTSAVLSARRGQADYLRDLKLKIPPRTFAYNVGDTVQTEIEVAVAKRFVLATDKLPAGRVKLSNRLELKILKFEEKKLENENRYRLVFRYQIFFIPNGVEHFEIPDYPLRFSDGKTAFAVVVPAYRLTVSALTNEAERQFLEMAPDRRPTKPNIFWLVAAGSFSLLLLLTVVGATLYPVIKDAVASAKRSPFKKALVKIGKATSQEELHIIVHRAINSYAEKVVFASGLADFFAAHPLFVVCEPELKAFFDSSDRFFFADESLEQKSIGEVRSRLKVILKKLRDAERKERRRGR